MVPILAYEKIMTPEILFVDFLIFREDIIYVHLIFIYNLGVSWHVTLFFKRRNIFKRLNERIRNLVHKFSV